MKRALIRADASARIGGGHVTRCAALGDALVARGWRIGFATRPETWAVVPELPRPGPDDVVLAPDCELDSAVVDGVDLLVVDHYGWDQERESSIRRRVGIILAIDDIARPHDADILVDQNFGRSVADYAGRVPPGCPLLLGPQYALLSPRFARVTPLRDGPDVAKRVLVSLGRTDPIGATIPILDGLLATSSELKIEIMLGGQSPQLMAAQERAALFGSRAVLHVDPSDPLSIMATCDLAIGAVGGSAWERCCLGLPSLVVICANNQRDAATALAKQGIVTLLGDAGSMSPAELSVAVTNAVARILIDKSERDRLSNAARRLCDGRGAERVADVVESILAAA